MVTPPRKAVTQSTVFEFRFRLPTRTKFGDIQSSITASGIGFNQFIGVRFQDSIFTFTSSLPECTLSSATLNYSVKEAAPSTSPVSSVSTDSNTFYCQLLDKTNTNLPSGEVLTLKVKFATAISHSWIHNISLFTSTTNNQDQIIIDNLPNVASVGLYSDYLSSNNNRVVEINSGTQLTYIQSPGDRAFSTLYPNFTIDTEVIVEINQYWSPDPTDYIFFVKFSTTNFGMPTSITTKDASTAKDDLKITSSLTFTEMADEGVIISGFAKTDLYPKRKFILVLSGMKTTDANLGQSTKLSMYVYYKNTYSIISYSEVNMDVVQVAQITNAAVHHPEYFYMYDGMGWPFQFDFHVDADFAEGGFVMIRQTSWDITKSSVSLVAASCDFSETNVEQTFGKRWNCYPLRNDFNHDSESGLTGEGSGIYFKIANISMAIELYKVKVWGFIDKCYNSTNGAKNYAQTLSFAIRIFKWAFTNDTYSNEANFFTTTKNRVIAQNTNVSMTDNCWPLQTRAESVTDANWLPDPALIMQQRNSDNKLPIGIEINNINILKPLTSTTDYLANVNKSGGTTPWKGTSTGADTWDDTNFPRRYLYGGTSSEIANNNLLLVALIRTVTNATTGPATYELSKYIPNECFGILTGNFLPAADIADPRIQFLFSREFLTEKDAITSTGGCFLSWQFLNNNQAANSATSSLVYPNNTGFLAGADPNVDIYLTTITSKKILTTASPITTVNINMDTNTSKSQINTSSATSTSLTFKITSNTIDFTSTATRKLSMTGYDCHNTFTGITAGANNSISETLPYMIYTSCLQWGTIPATVKSLYTYFEIQQVLLRGGLYPTRVLRLIKLYPELGLFQDPTATKTGQAYTTAAEDKWISGYYEVTTSAATPFAVCLIEIYTKFISASQGTSKTLLVWLFATSLLDVDVNDVSSEYPVAPVTATSYGLNSGQTMSLGFRRIGDPAELVAITNDLAYPNIKVTTDTTKRKTKFSEFEMYFFKTVLDADFNSNQTALDSTITTGFEPKTITMYHMFLGSLVIIPTSSNPSGTDTTKNIYIPILCPSGANTSSFDSATATYPSNGIYFTYPIATVAWGDMDRYNSVSKINYYISGTALGKTLETITADFTINAYPVGGATKDPIHVPLLMSPSKNTGLYFNTVNDRVAAASDRSTSLKTLKTQFQPYTLTTDNKDKQLKMTNSETTGIQVSSLMVFLGDKIDTLSTSVTQDLASTNPDNTFKIKSISNHVYIMGKPFNRFLAYTEIKDSGVIKANHPLTGTDAYSNATSELGAAGSVTATGIPRLAVSHLDNTTWINPLNFLAVFTGRSVTKTGTTKTGILSNLKIIESGTSVTFDNFLLWHPENVDQTWNAVLGLDSAGSAIKDDRGGNIKITGTFPTEVPQGSKVTITFDGSVIQSSDYTVCGLVENGAGNVATTCTINSQAFTCQFSKRTTNFEVCCYNIYNDNTTMTAKSGILFLPFNTDVITTTVISSFPNTWYSDPNASPASNENMDTYDFSTRAVTDISSTSTSFFAKLNDIKYSLSSSNEGYGLAKLEINLPRNAVRGMQLDITADFTKFKITNLVTRIVPTFGNSELYGSSLDQGDLFVDSIYSNLDSTGLKLKLKNMLYKCALSLGTSLNIYLWPVATYNYSNLDVTVAMKGPDGSNLASSTSHTVSSSPEFTHSPKVSAISADLCKLSSVTPNIVDEYAEYLIELVFNQFSTTLENEIANEVVIAIPYMYYGDTPDVVCYSSTSQLQCNYIEKSLLSVRFGSNINTSGDSNIQLRLVGLKNPYLATNNGVYWGCSVNNTNYLTNTRNTLVRGYMTFTEGIFPAADTVFGNIVFKNEFCRQSFTTTTSSSSNTNTNEGTEVADEEALNPREDPPKINPSYRTVHEFGFSVDIANNSISGWDNGFNFSNSPVLYITFPADYKFHWYSFVPEAVIEEWNINQQDNTLIEKNATPSLTVDTITIVGNQVRITFTQGTINFKRFFQYFIIKLFHLPPPVDNTVNTSTNRITTEAFKFLMFNSNKSQIFRNWTNLNNFSNQDILTNKISNLLPQNKGFKYEFDQKKWIIDPVDKNLQRFNEFAIHSGRFIEYVFKVRSTTKLLTPAKVDIELSDAKVSFAVPTYTVASALNSDIPFLVGIACGSDPGNLIIKASLVNSSSNNVYKNFMPLSPWKVEVKTAENGTVRFIRDNIVRINGSLFVDFTTSESPFENLEITFQTSTDSLIENARITAGSSTIRTVMRITNSEASAVQSYSMGTPQNNCFVFEHDKINFTIDGVAAIIPNDALKSRMFEYRNADTDTDISANAVKFVFTTDYTQIYIYAVLTCLNDEFPTDDNMKTQNVTATNRLSYLSEILNIQGSADLVFNNLIRNVPYKLKVFIESTQGDRTLRTSSTIIISNSTLTNGTTVDIIASRPVTTLCASYRFDTRPGTQITNPLLWYWQQKYSSGGYYEGGCISAVDQFGTDIPGLPSIKNETNCGRANCRFIDPETYIVNQTSLGISETYIVCAYPLSYCAANPSNYEEKFNELLTELATNTTMNEVLNTRVVPSFVLTQVSDRNVPSNPTVTNFAYSGGKVTFDSVSTVPISCYVRASSDGQPSANEFEVCGVDCYVVNISATQGSYSVNVSGSGSVTLYGVCYNDMPCSQSKTGVISFGTYTSDTGTGGTNNTNTTNPNTTDPNSSSMNNFNIFVFLALMMALLI